MKNNLDFLMAKNNVTVSQLARDLKVSRTSIYRLFEGKNPSANLMLKIAVYFNADVKDIFFTQNVQQVERASKKNRTA